MKKILALLFALMLISAISTAAFAEVPAQPAENQADTSQAASTIDPLPQIADITPDDTEESAQAVEPEQEQPEDSQEETAPILEQEKSSNTPYFVGAVIAVLVFIGVALYCKFNGNGGISR